MSVHVRDLTRRAACGLLAAAATGPALAQPPLVMNARLRGKPLRIAADPRFAGTISSLMFREREHVDAADHGRLFQSALQFGGLGECMNPTQAGASVDRARSSSLLMEQRIGAGLWETSSQMAWWNRRGDRCTTPEGLRRRPPVRGRRADVLCTVRHSFDGGPVVRSEVVFTLASPRPAVVVEALTLYAPATFSRFDWLQRGRLVQDADLSRPGERAEPRVLSTTDGRHAIALLSPDPRATFGRWRFADCGKLNVVFRPGDLLAGVHTFALAWTLGTSSEVAATIRAFSG